MLKQPAPFAWVAASKQVACRLELTGRVMQYIFSAEEVGQLTTARLSSLPRTVSAKYLLVAEHMTEAYISAHLLYVRLCDEIATPLCFQELYCNYRAGLEP